MIVTSIGYLCFSYFAFKNEMYSIWLHFILTILSTMIQVTACHIEMQELFPMIIYDDEDYTPTTLELITKFILRLLYILTFLVLLFIAQLFLFASDTPYGLYLLQTLSLGLIFISILHYVLDGFSHYAGHAYTTSIMKNNSNERSFSLLPASITNDTMEIYMRDYYMIAR
jgi:hypothetical protein